MSAAPKYMAVQGAALIVAAAVTVIGVASFIPGVTADFDRFSWVGQHSGARLFGIFAVSGLVNIVHLVIGALGFVMARSYARARAYLLGGGIVYLGLWLYGVLVERAVHVVPLNAAANWLHLVLGFVMALLAVTLGGQRDPTKRRRRLRRAAT